MNRPLDIVSLGARTPLGLSAASTAAAMRAGLSRCVEYAFVHADGEPIVAGADPRLEPGVDARERMAVMAASAVREAVEALSAERIGRAEVWLTVPEARPGFTDLDASTVADETRRRLRDAGIPLQVQLAGRGHAGVAVALDVVRGEARAEGVAFVVGVDSYLDAETLMWLAQERLLDGPETRAGFVPGEAAACLAVVTEGARAALGLEPLATVRGVGVAQETLLRDSDTGSFGQALEAAVRAATAGLPASYVLADINGERYRSEEWGFMALRAHDALATVAYDTLTEGVGDVGAASGALAGVLATQAFVRGHAQGPRTLVTTGSMSGTRGAILFTAPTQERA